MRTLACANGHQWPETASTPGGGNASPRCPACGLPAVAPSDTPPDPEVASGKTLKHKPTLLTANLRVEQLATSRRDALPGYEILEILGQGGMGVVYKAVQLSLKRVVALKVMKAADTDEGGLARFKREAESIARLQHPHIVQIYEIGTHEGQPYFSLEYVEGGTLAMRLKRSLPPLRESAGLVEALARAVHHAHMRGIVHRDLKPGNILLTGAEERDSTSGTSDATKPLANSSPIPRLSSLVPKITDFGLAKYFMERTDEPLTQSGVAVGTPSYMAPEQAAGESSSVSPATDVYALGAILYELLTGRPPFVGATPLHTMTQVLQDEPMPPGSLRAGLPRDLETICLTCLHKDPARRYPTAEALADDLRAFLVGGSIQARSPTRSERLTRWGQRHPVWMVLAGLGVVGILTLVLNAFWFDVMAASAVAIFCILGGAAWYNSRLQVALKEANRQNVRAERNAQRLALLLETTHRMLTMQSPEDLLQLLSETSTRMLDAERATIFLVDRAKNELWSKVALGDGVGEIRVPLGQGIAGASGVSGEAIILADPYADSRFNPDVDRRTGFVTRNLLTLPMIGANGAILGVFQILNKRGGAFGPEDAEILTPLAASAARVVELTQRPE
jgi:serine/threonine protein kinase